MAIDATSELRARSRHEPGAVEEAVFARWEAAGFGGDPGSGRPSFVIALPPPNVTGELHMGHALNGTTQDTLMRVRRKQGYETLWICGTDHAGIATQNVVERELRREGLTRHDLGREAFVERVWEWRRRYGAAIIGQYKRLGASLDYGNERFTMDEGYARAVTEVFVDLFHKGLLYRGNRIVNWCVGCATAVSDLEVRHETQRDTLYSVRYAIAGSDEAITVATVRPETILADTAVAVHPDDRRYAHLVGRTAVVPLVDREVPIIADEYVKREFGTGALKVTPGHDPNDFEIGLRHRLAELSAIGPDGRMTDLAGPYAGLTVADAQRRVVEDLEARALLIAREEHVHEVGHCDRSGDRIEPLVSLQWFMRMDELARPAIEAVRDGTVTFHPPNHASTYLHWMEAIRPWCVSRQLWWGHQLPVWYCPDGHVTVERSTPAACAECGARELRRDTDVLDTWFSSALWPFATLGWPERTERLAAFYPGDVLSTDRGIINLWVARMLMMGLEYLDTVPFTDVLIHSTIQAPDGRRMSKSLGTGINPLDLIDRYGADATRYGLLKMSSTQDVRFAEGMIDEGAKFANKLWNASRFVLLGADLDAEPEPRRDEAVDRWILSRLASASAEVLRLVDEYDFAAAVKALYAFVWNDFCDWYIESAKARLAGDDADARRASSSNLLWVLERILHLTHPMMPFVTEEIWRFLPGRSGLLMDAPMPAFGEEHRDEAAERDLAAVFEAVGGLRRLRQELGIAPGQTLPVALPDGFPQPDLVERLGRADLRAGDGEGIPLAAGSWTVLVGGREEAVAYRDRLSVSLRRASAERDRARGKLANARFTERAPAHLVEEEREKERRFAREADEIEARLGALG